MHVNRDQIITFYLSQKVLMPHALCLTFAGIRFAPLYFFAAHSFILDRLSANNDNFCLPGTWKLLSLAKGRITKL